jgi:hypothetical protein
MSASSNVFVIDLVVRMVVPMRREFGRSLDVQQFMRDAGYATEVLAQALNSHVPRLREYADQVRRELTGISARERQTGVTAYDQYVRARKLGARPSADVAKGDVPGVPAAKAASAAAAPSSVFLSQRREAVRALTDLAGPMGDHLALRMERCVDTAALRTLTIEAGQLIAHLRGQTAAARYVDRCAPPPRA